MKTYVGIDYHKAYSYGVIMTQDRQVLKRQRFPNHPQALAGFLGEHAGPDCAAALEATRNWTVMHDWLEEHVGQVVLAHPLKLKATAEARIKTDKIDATTLADLLRCDLVPAAHVSSPLARAIKRLLRHRMFMVRVCGMVKNRVHDLLDRLD